MMPLYCATVGELINAYMLAYKGRDPGRGARLAEWDRRLGTVLVAELTDDHVFRELADYESQPARIYKGRDVHGTPIYRAKGPRAPSTINRFRDTLAAVCTWAKRQRRVPKGWTNPFEEIAKHKEPEGRVRFLSDAERTRLLAACAAQPWPRLRVMVLLSIITGARRGELEGLRWRDVKPERAEIHLAQTKNDQPRVLVLTPGVLEDLMAFRDADQSRFGIGTPTQLVFHSEKRPDVPFNFEKQWRAALLAAHVRKFRWHDLRHTCASYLAQQNATLLEIAEVLGHRQLAMTRRYAHLTTQHKRALVGRVMGDIR